MNKIDKLAAVLKDAGEAKEKKKTEPYDTTAKVVKVEGSTAWVNIPGGVDKTPATMVVNAKTGEEVRVHVAGGKAYVTGNATSPPTDDSLAQRAENNAIRAQNAADSASRDAKTAKVSADSAVKDAGVAKESADNAVKDAARAYTAAESAQASATAANTAAQEAKADAATANEAATNALRGLSTVEDVVDVLTWITEHGIMTSQAGGTFVDGQVYFIVDPNGDYEVGGTRYSVVQNPVASDIDNYYILSVDEAVTNYVATHIAVDAEGLWIIPDTNNGNRVLIATGAGTQYTTAGTYIVGNGGAILAEFLASSARVGENANGVTRTELSGDGMDIIRKAGDTDKTLAHIGYGSGTSSGGGTANAPYYTLGTRATTTTAYSNSSTYAVGDLCVYNSKVYVCITAITTAESWTSSHWQLAIGNYSLAEGEDATASGYDSHAEGYNTTASGDNSHAEGSGTTASKYGTHAEGKDTTASIYCAHAEGEETTASGNRAHAEGGYTTASGDTSHSEGASCTASGDNSHAEGDHSAASSDNSHAEGYHTSASGNSAHAEGYYTEAVNIYAHAEGYYTKASKQSAHAEGYHTTASGNQAHAGGIYTIAGYNNQTVIGTYNDNKSGDLFEIGNGTGVNARSNAFEVDSSGNVTSAGKMTVGTAPANNMDVSTKKYVDDKASGYLPLTGGSITGNLSVSGTFNGFVIAGANGTRWNLVPVVNASGVMEVGKYIDFHETGTGSEDYTARLNCNSAGTLIASGAEQASNYYINNHTTPIGDQIRQGLTTAKSLTANTWTELFSFTLPAGTWLIIAGFRCPSSASGLRLANIEKTSKNSSQNASFTPSGNGVNSFVFTKCVTISAATIFYYNVMSTVATSASTGGIDSNGAGYGTFYQAIRLL